MSAQYMTPAELESRLRFRLAEIKAGREERARRRVGVAGAARGSSRGKRPRITAVLVGGALAMLATVAFATHAGTEIDLTVADAVVEHQDAVFIQGGLGAGTGTFDPFLTLSTNEATEAGYNQCDDPGCTGDPNFDQFFGGGRTHELLVSAVPVITFEGERYREFSLDANDQGADSFMSVDEIKVYLDDQDDLTGYDDGTETFTNDSGDIATKVFDLDQVILVESQTLEPGSGVSDITVLLPVDLFPADCDYGSLTCDTFLIFYTESGNLGTDLGDGRDYDVTAGFEEWRVQLLPVVNVTKTAAGSVDRAFPWDVAKEADGEPDHIDLFAGDTATIDWTVTATVGTPVDSNLSVSGTITVTNPTGGDVIEDDIPATINSVSDILTQGVTDTPLTVSCPESFPFTLGAGDSLVCTYTGTPPNSDAGTNTATANIDISETETADYSGTAPVAFSVSEIDECVEVTDDNATPGDTSDDLLLDAELCEDESPGVYNFSTTVGPFDVEECGSTTVTNTAFTETNDTATQDEASDSVTVDCHELTVTKDAIESLTRTFPWDVAKEADGEPDHIDLFAGDTATIDWTVTATVGTAVDSGWAVTGTIMITNPAPIPADDVSVADMLTGAIAATVDCDAGAGGNQTTVDVPASGSASCSYSATLPDGTNRTNTATATLFGVDYDGTAAVNFAEAVVDEIDECVEVTDDNATPGDTSDDLLLDAELCEDESPGVYNFSTTVGPFDVEECGSTTVTNTAFTETNDTATQDEASDSVTVDCHELTVTKNAVTTYSRDYDWDIAKARFIASGEDDGDGDPLTLTLDEGQTYTANYEVTVTMTGFTDADHAVSGTITISNPAPMIAVDVAVTDVISHAVDPDINATVDCGGGLTTVDVPAATIGGPGTATCSYSAALPNADDRLNTATATLFGIGYDGTANIAFDLNNPTTEIDECIHITDDAGTPGDTSDDLDLGMVCVGDLDGNDQWTDEYTLDIGPFAVCGEFEFTNTVSFVTTDDDNDTDESGSATYTVTVIVPCPEGCTLTQGYWKTHNDLFRVQGGPEPDETWELLPNGEETIFFLSGQTYFEVMWTAPKGNAYYILAVQYIAAELNMLDGADGSAIADAFADATVLFETHTPAQVAELKGKNGKELRAEFIELAGILASYNEGLIGPGHCDEDGTSEQTAASTLLADRRTSFTMS